MNNRGEINAGYIILAAIAIIFVMALIVPIAQNQGTLTNIANSSNVSYTLPANGTYADLVACGQLNVTNVVIYNYSDGTQATGNSTYAGNFTVNQSVGSDGYLATRIYWDSKAGAYVKAGYMTNVTCQYEPKGYNHDAASRNIAALILVFCAIAIVVVGIRKDWFEF